MDIVRIILILGGCLGLFLAGFKVDFAHVSPGWLGAAAIAIALLLQIAVK